MARKSSQISSFTSKGNKVAGTIGSGKLASLGHFDPSTGRVYDHPRVKADPLTGGSVKVTNRKSTGPARNERTASLGMGAVGQVGRSGRDVGAASE